MLPCGIPVSPHLCMLERPGDGVEQGTAERHRTAQLLGCGSPRLLKRGRVPSAQTHKQHQPALAYKVTAFFAPSLHHRVSGKRSVCPRVNFHSLSPRLPTHGCTEPAPFPGGLLVAISTPLLSFLAAETPPSVNSRSQPAPQALASWLQSSPHPRTHPCPLSLLALRSLSCAFPAFTWSRAPGTTSLSLQGNLRQNRSHAYFTGKGTKAGSSERGPQPDAVSPPARPGPTDRQAPQTCASGVPSGCTEHSLRLQT